MLSRLSLSRRSLSNVAAAVFACAAFPSLADYSTGIGAYSRKDFPAARAAFQQVAQLADPGAQRALATMYARGEGGEVDLVAGYAWATLAVDQGDVTASKIRDAIAAGLPPALKPQAEARVLEYRSKYSAEAVKRDLLPSLSANEPIVFSADISPARVRKQSQIPFPEKALEKSEQGFACVSFFVDSTGKALDVRRYDGRGGGQFGAAAEKGIVNWSFEAEPSERRVGHCVEFMIEDDKTWRSPELIKQQQAKARKGDARSQLEVARSFGAAQHTLTDRIDAQTVTDAWLQAALSGAPEAQLEIAQRLLRADGCVSDRDKALRWLKLSLEQNHGPAQQFAAVALANEKALALTPAQQLEWLRAAANAGNVEAQLQLAKKLLRSGPSQDIGSALALLKKLDKDYHIHVHDWRAYAYALSGDFDSALDEAEDALELATDIGLATTARQAAVDLLTNGSVPAIPAN